MTLLIVGIFVFLIVLAVLIFVFLGDFRKASEMYSSQSNKSAENKNNDTLKPDSYELENEVRRLQLIVDELKYRANQNLTISLKKDISQNTGLDMIELTRQKQIIEQEKKLFQEKNKKLWDQSIAIHKEKDRIDALRQEIETRHREILDSINYAKRIQNALVTSKEYLTKYLSDFFIFWAPKNVVSGDFYWAKHLDKGLMIIVADCTGHGVPGAFMSLLGISFLNEITAHNPSIEPAELLEMLRIKVKVSLNQNDQFFGNKDGMDMSCILMNSEEKSILFAGANNPMWLFRNNEIEIFDATKNPIGVFRKEQNFIQMEVKIEEDDIVYLFSDGYADQFGGNSNSKFKRVNLKNTLLTVSQEKLKMESAGDIIETVFNEWKNNNAQTDDVIIMGIRI